MTAQRRMRSTEAFFGRRRGKGLKPAQLAAMKRLLPMLKLDLGTPAPLRLADLYRRPLNAVRLEIGFGGGEHLLSQVRDNAGIGFIGVEPFVNGMAKLVSALSEEWHDNLLVHDDDATLLLDWLPDASLDRIDLFYPDPWPKRRHWKRRFVNKANLDRFARVLMPGGLFRFASDIDTYVNWTLLHCRAHRDFNWLAHSAADWRTPYPGWPGTRYEAKAVREGRRPAYLTFVRGH